MKVNISFILLFVTLLIISCGFGEKQRYSDYEVEDSTVFENEGDYDYEYEDDYEYEEDYEDESLSNSNESHQNYTQPAKQRTERIQVPCTAYGCQGGSVFCTNCNGQGYYDTGYDFIKCGQCNNGRRSCVVCNGLGYTWQERLVDY